MHTRPRPAFNQLILEKLLELHRLHHPQYRLDPRLLLDADHVLNNQIGQAFFDLGNGYKQPPRRFLITADQNRRRVAPRARFA